MMSIATAKVALSECVGSKNFGTEIFMLVLVKKGEISDRVTTSRYCFERFKLSYGIFMATFQQNNHRAATAFGRSRGHESQYILALHQPAFH